MNLFVARHKAGVWRVEVSEDGQQLENYQLDEDEGIPSSKGLDVNFVSKLSDRVIRGHRVLEFTPKEELVWWTTLDGA